MKAVTKNKVTFGHITIEEEPGGSMKLPNINKRHEFN